MSKFIVGQDHLCTFCNNESETVIHLFWECPKTNFFWSELAKLLNSRAMHAHNFRFTKWLILFGTSDCIKTDLVCDLIILIGKFYIYKCKVLKIEMSISSFMKEIYSRYCIEQEIYKNPLLFKTKWAPYKNLFKSLM